MNRYYLSSSEWDRGDLWLTGDEANHCSRVMRAEIGDRVQVFDGEGQSAIVEILSVSRQKILCREVSKSQSLPVIYPITLCQAIPKGGNMELIVQKAVELGVSNIQPLITSHTVARPESVEKKQLKWQRIALEACKQCGQDYLPQVLKVQTFHQWIDKIDGQNPYTMSNIAALDERAVHFKKRFEVAPAPGEIALLVGPEGDFTREEYEAAYRCGFKPVSFGDIVMRVETAAIYGISVLQHELSAIDLS